MTEQEKVIKGLECCAHEEIGDCGNCPYNSNTPHCDIQMMRDAITLLEEQKPIKPKMMEFVDEGVTWQKYELPTCEKCGTLLGDALFCPQCGRAVKWE